MSPEDNAPENYPCGSFLFVWDNIYMANKKKNLGGRPTVFTEPVIEKLEEAFEIGCSDREAALHAGIHVSSLYNYYQTNPKFKDRVEALKESLVYKARRTVAGSIESSTTTSQWYLERKRRDEFSGRTEITGKDGAPIAGLTEDQKKKLDNLFEENVQ